MNRDFVEMLSALSAAGADHLVVGAHAVAVHGRPRATGDLDIWVRPTRQNAERVWRALAEFGASLQDLTINDLTSADLVFQIGVVPNRIDILTDLTGLEFDDAWQNRVTIELSGVQVPVLARQDLIRNKRALGRPRDLADIAELEEGSD